MTEVAVGAFGMAVSRTRTPGPDLSIKNRLTVRRLLADQARQGTLARALSSKALRWVYGAALAEKLHMVPPDLRTADTTFVHEYRDGHFGLAGTSLALHDLSPFDIAPPNEDWQRELLGFGWLRHFTMSEDEEAHQLARDLVIDWIKHPHPRTDPCWQPDILARRLISWMSHANVILASKDARSYDIITQSLGRQYIRLLATWRRAPQGVPRLTALTGLLMATLCIEGHDSKIKQIQRLFLDELDAQIKPDGGHVSRNVSISMALLFDLLPLEKCYGGRELTVPEALKKSCRAMIGFLQFMRHGNGRLAHFNGVGVPEGASLATLLAYDDGDHPRLRGGAAQHAGYARLVNGKTIVLADIGPAPELEFSLRAQAGCLSFEMSIDDVPVFVNSGLPGRAHEDWMAVARATASQNTLCLAETSSAQLMTDTQLENLLGGHPISLPENVESSLSNRQGAQSFNAHHDGYLRRFGILHHRELKLSASGRVLDGVDRLAPPDGHLRLKQDLPFAIHFHLHPDIRDVEMIDRDAAEITLPNGVVLLLKSSDVLIGCEDSYHFADSSAPQQALQIVLRGATYGECLIRWSITRQ